MSEPNQSPRNGEFFSRNYLRVECLQSDDIRARRRFASYCATYFRSIEYEVSVHIENELGIDTTELKYYKNWQKLIDSLSVADFLDVITALIRKMPYKIEETYRVKVKHDLLDFSRSVFLENHLTYRIDDKGGIHPAIDTEFSTSIATIIRGLASIGLAAALEHVQTAEKAMLAHTFDGRHAVRATFDAVENIAKVVDPKKTKLDAKIAKETLGNLILTNCGTSPEEKRAAGKLIDSLCNWVDSAHNYRHSPSGIEVSQPSEAFTVAFVSQGFSYIRWICDAYASSQACATPTT